VSITVGWNIAMAVGTPGLNYADASCPAYCIISYITIAKSIEELTAWV
jgi:hypothetical protein